MEVIIQAARLLADYELLAHSLQVLPFQPPPTVSHASSSRRKSWDHPKPNPIPRQRQRSGLCTFPQIPSTKTREVTLRGGKKRRSRAKYPRPPPADRCRGSADRRSPSGRLSEGELRVRARTNIFKGAATFITLLVLLVYAPVSSAQETEAQAPPGAPKLDAGSWTLIDANTGLYLAGKDPDKRVAIASTTKVMLALVAFDEGVNFDDEVTVSESAAKYAGSVYSNVGLYPYDRVSVGDLLMASLVPSGIDAKGNYSSANDLAKITREVMKYPEFREIVATPEATISTQGSSVDRKIDVVNTNLLVVPNSGYEYGPATGVKTGTSPQAGACLVASAQSDDESYIAVVLDAGGDVQRFQAARGALEYGFGE